MELAGREWKALMEHCLAAKVEPANKNSEILHYPIIYKGDLYFTDSYKMIRAESCDLVKSFPENGTIFLKYDVLETKIAASDSIIITEEGLFLNYKQIGTWETVERMLSKSLYEIMEDARNNKFNADKEATERFFQDFMIDTDSLKVIYDTSKAFKTGAHLSLSTRQDIKTAVKVYVQYKTGFPGIDAVYMPTRA